MTLGGGIQTDIVSGLPKERTVEAIQNQAKQIKRYAAALELDIADKGGSVLDELKETIIAHAERVLAQDPVYQLYHKFITELGLKIHTAKVIVEKHERQAGIRKEKPPAPFGIPGK